MRYEMRSDARARAVAKELVQIAKELGRKLSLTAAQKAVASMLDYENWHAMHISLGDRQGPEDTELSASQLEARVAMQEAALVEAGFTLEEARHAIQRLRPTGRTAGAISANRRVHLVESTGDYHPNRVRQVLDLAESQLPSWDGYVDTIDVEYQLWADSRPLSRLDDLARRKDQPVIARTYDLEDLEKTGHIVDVAGIVDSMQDHVLSEGWEDMPADPGELNSYYLYFGPHRLPSPFPGVGVDGCYVRIWESLSGPGTPPDDVSFEFTTSEEFDRDNPDTVPFLDYMLGVRAVLRTISIGFSPSEGERVGASIEAGPRDNAPEEYHESWRPYLPRLLDVAWNSLRAYRGRRFGIFDAVLSDVDRSLVERLERAGSEAAVRKALKRITDQTMDMPVRFLGRTPPAGEMYEELRASPYPRADSGVPPQVQDLDALLADVVEASHPSSMYFLARRASNMAVGMFLPVDTAMAERLLRANALLMNAAFVVEQPEAEEAARHVLASPLAQAAEYLPGAFIVFASQVDQVGAEQALERLKASRPGTPMTKWCSALHASLFCPEEAHALVVEAAMLDRTTAEKVLEMDRSPWSWFARTSGYEDYEDELDHAACMTGELFYRSECRHVIYKALGTLEAMNQPVVH